MTRRSTGLDYSSPAHPQSICSLSVLLPLRQRLEMTELSIRSSWRLDGSKQGLGASCESGAAFQSRMKRPSEYRLLLNRWLPSLNGPDGDALTARPLRFESKVWRRKGPGRDPFRNARHVAQALRRKRGGPAQGRLHKTADASTWNSSSAFQRGSATWSRRRARLRANCRSRNAAERREIVFGERGCGYLLGHFRPLEGSQLRTYSDGRATFRVRSCEL